VKVFVTRRLPGGALDRLSAEHDVEVWAEQPPPGKAELLARAPELEGLLSLLTDPVDAELIAAAPRLRAISNYAVGVDNVDLDAAAERGIPVGNTPGVLTDTTADLAVALMLGISRHLVEGDAYVRRGEWRTWETGLLLGHDLHGATVGVVGFGRIGQAVARRLEGFGCEILHTSRSGGVPLGELLERSDVVTVHSPLTPETRGLIGDGALDVTDPEPLPAGHPLLDAPNLLVLPHLGSATHATRERMADMAVDNLLAGLAGERMPHCANPELYAA
jgi:glyoxylate reductase